MERADALVHMANVAAIGMFMTLLRRFPVMRETDVKHFDFIVTIAGVFIAVTRLRNLRLGEIRERKLMDKVSERLTEWNPEHGIRAFEHCKSFYDRTADGLANTGHYPKFVASDAIGAWVVWDVLNRAPETEEERSLVRAIGVTIVHGIFN